MKKILFLFLIFFHSFLSAQNKDLIYYFKARANSNAGNFENAIFYIDSALMLNANKQYFFEKGLIYYKSNLLNKALNIFFISAQQEKDIAWLYAAKVYAKLNNPDSSIFYLKKYLRKKNKIFRSKIRTDTDFNFIANSQQWKDLWKQKHYSETELLEEDIIFYIDNKKYAEALILLNNALKKNKKNHKAYFLKGKIFFETENYNSAIKNFNKAIDLYTLDYEYFVVRGKAFLQNGKPQKAISDFSRALKLNPYELNLYIFLAKAYYANGEYDKALEKVDFFLQIYPHDSKILFFKAEIFFAQGDFLNTISILNSIFYTYPNRAELYALRGMAYLNAHSYDLAFSDFSQALDLNPSMTDLYLYRGEASFKLGNKNAACADWKNAIENKHYEANKFYYENCYDYEKNLNKKK